MITNQNESLRKGILSFPLMRDLLVIALLVVVVWKLLDAEINVDLASFSFNDFLALVLALFSVALSVAFYFKANEASNQFYDNTYKFTKDMSEILGRIEAGFGERLRHLDEGYSGVRDRLERLSYYSATPSEVKQEEEEIKRKEEEQRSLIEDIVKKAKLAEHEKKELLSNLAQKHDELEQAKNELRRMQESQHSTRTTPSRRTVIDYVVRTLQHKLPNSEFCAEVDSSTIRNLFSKYRDEISKRAISDMQDLGLLDNEGNLTRRAILLMRDEWNLI